MRIFQDRGSSLIRSDFGVTLSLVTFWIGPSTDTNTDMEEDLLDLCGYGGGDRINFEQFWVTRELFTSSSACFPCAQDHAIPDWVYDLEFRVLAR